MYFVRTPVFLKYLFPDVIWSSATDSRLRLTFDDGPDPASTPQLLDLLAETNTKATFFCLGQQVEKHPELFEAIKAAGHQIGNHGYAHISGWKSSHKSYIENMEQGKEWTQSSLYRPPYGQMTFRQYHSIKKENQIVGWSLMPGDFDDALSEQVVKKRLSWQQQDAIVVLHESAKAFPKIKFALS